MHTRGSVTFCPINVAMSPSQIQLINTSQILALVFAIACPMYWVFVTGKLWPAVAFGYVGFVCWGFAVCLVMPVFFSDLFHDKRVFEYFPEGPGATVMLFMGWLPSLLFGAIAMGLRNLWLRRRRAPPHAPTA